MKKQGIYSLTALVVLCVCISSCSPPTSSKLEGILGPIKSIDNKVFEAEVGSDQWDIVDTTFIQHYSVRYDESGMITKTKGYDNNGEQTYTCVNSYTDGLLDEQAYSFEGSDDGQTIEYEYEDKNHFEFESRDEDGKLQSKGETIRDGLEIVSMKGKYYMGEETMRYESEFEYEDGRLSLVRQNNSEQDEESISYFSYQDFDHHDNWTRSMIMAINEADTSYQLTIRELKYRD